jgi:hypothetical protein
MSENALTNVLYLTVVMTTRQTIHQQAVIVIHMGYAEFDVRWGHRLRHRDVLTDGTGAQ